MKEFPIPNDHMQMDSNAPRSVSPSSLTWAKLVQELQEARDLLTGISLSLQDYRFETDLEARELARRGCDAALNAMRTDGTGPNVNRNGDLGA